MKPIKTNKEYESALSKMEQLMDAKEGTPELDELEVLAILVEDYEKKSSLIDLDKKNQLYECVKNFIKEQEISHSETIYQCDHVIVESLEFIEKCCDIVGYHEREEE